MHVSINIPFTTSQELSTILATLQRDLKLGVEVAMPTTEVQAPVDKAPVPTAVSTKSKKKAPPVVAAPEPVAVDTTPIQITKVEATSALQVLNNKKGLPAARLILSKFKTEKGTPCQRLSELKESDYAAFYESCIAEAGN